MNITIIIYSNVPETVWNAFRFANTALAAGAKVSVFLLGMGVESGNSGTLVYDVQEQMEIFRSQTGSLIGCGLCCENRKDEMPYLMEELKCDRGSMQQLYDLVVQSDRVITF